jgi:hypothetical protein
MKLKYSRQATSISHALRSLKISAGLSDALVLIALISAYGVRGCMQRPSIK